MKTLADLDGLSLRDVLRDETDALHNKLHEQISFASLLNGTLERSEYQRLIKRLYGFYAPLDDAVLGALKDGGTVTPFQYEKRSRLIAKDILDLDPGAALPPVGSLCQDIAQVVTPTTVGGVLYVVEGATMGGALINKAAQRLLARDSIDGRRYWDWCRVEGRNRWQMTLHYLEQLRPTGQSLDDLVYGARTTFRLLDEWLAPLNTRSNRGTN